MGQFIFTEFELQVLETARIVGGKGGDTHPMPLHKYYGWVWHECDTNQLYS